MTKQHITNALSWLLLAVVVVYFAYSKGWIFAGFESITPQQVQSILENDKDVFLLDVRTEEEFNQEFINGATLIPVQVLAQNLSKIEKVKEKKIIVYCHSGNRSVQASRILVENGFHPLNMKGGIMEWKSSGLPIERGQ